MSSKLFDFWFYHIPKQSYGFLNSEVWELFDSVVKKIRLGMLREVSSRPVHSMIWVAIVQNEFSCCCMIIHLWIKAIISPRGLKQKILWIFEGKVQKLSDFDSGILVCIPWKLPEKINRRLPHIWHTANDTWTCLLTLYNHVASVLFRPFEKNSIIWCHLESILK